MHQQAGQWKSCLPLLTCDKHAIKSKLKLTGSLGNGTSLRPMELPSLS